MTFSGPTIKGFSQIMRQRLAIRMILGSLVSGRCGRCLSFVRVPLEELRLLLSVPWLRGGAGVFAANLFGSAPGLAESAWLWIGESGRLLVGKAGEVMSAVG